MKAPTRVGGLSAVPVSGDSKRHCFCTSGQLTKEKAWKSAFICLKLKKTEHRSFRETYDESANIATVVAIPGTCFSDNSAMAV